MIKTAKGLIIKGVGGRYKVLSEGAVFNCVARGKIKLSDKLYVGDYVELVSDKSGWFINGILPRRNLMIRPYVANVDLLVIVVAPVPEPDWILVDKLLIFAAECKINTLICYNKTDIDDKGYEYAQRVYGGIVKTVALSANTGNGVAEFAQMLKGMVCFAGQSAVGKSSILNAICAANQSVGGLSKIERGRNTTRHVEIFKLTDDVSIVDTCGFSLLDVDGIDERELALYYPDFLDVGRCRYNMCTHRDEPDCAVKKALSEGRIDKDRYSRYLSIFEEIKQNRLKKL